MLKKLILIILFLLGSNPTMGSERRASWVEAVSGELKCFHASHGWLFDTTGPCSNFKPPDTIAVGESFEVDGKQIPINFIVVDDEKTGSVSCAAASDLSQIPSVDDTFADAERDRVWLFVAKCIPVN